MGFPLPLGASLLEERTAHHKTPWALREAYLPSHPGLWGKGILPIWGSLSTNGGNGLQCLYIFLYTTAHATQNPLRLRKSPY